MAETGGLFASGFETASLADWTGTNIGGTATATRDAAAKDHDSYGLKILGDGATVTVRAYKTFSSQTGTVYARCYFYIPSASIAVWTSCRILALWGASDTLRVAALLELDGTADHVRLVCYTNGPYVTPYSGSFGEVTVNAWHYVEISYKVDASTGGAQVWLDGTSKGSNFVQNTGGLDVDRVKVGSGADGIGDALGSGNVIYFDSVKVDTSYIGAYSATGGAPVLSAAQDATHIDLIWV